MLIVLVFQKKSVCYYNNTLLLLGWLCSGAFSQSAAKSEREKMEMALRKMLVSSINTSLAAPGALAHRLQRRTACNATPPATPLRPTYTPQIKKRRSLLYSNLGAPINFRKTSFLIRATFRLPSPYGGRQTSLGPPKSKNGDHFSIVIWALRTTFAK